MLHTKLLINILPRKPDGSLVFCVIQHHYLYLSLFSSPNICGRSECDKSRFPFFLSLSLSSSPFHFHNIKILIIITTSISLVIRLSLSTFHHHQHFFCHTFPDREKLLRINYIIYTNTKYSRCSDPPLLRPHTTRSVLTTCHSFPYHS